MDFVKIQKVNYDIDQTNFGNKILITSIKESIEKKEEYGFAFASKSNLKFFSLYKSSVFYKSNDLDICLSQYFRIFHILFIYFKVQTLKKMTTL